MKLNITIEIDDAEIARLFGREETRPEATELGRGLSYFNRAGEGPIYITFRDSDGDFRSIDGLWYHPNGKCLGGTDNDPRDLIISSVTY